MVIKQLAYKFYEKDEFIPLAITGNSGSFSEKPKETNAGTLYNTEISGYLPNITLENDELLNSIVSQKAIFLATDSAGLSYEVGTNDIKPTLEYEKVNEGKPGSKHGYNLKISLQYIKPAKMQVL